MEVEHVTKTVSILDGNTFVVSDRRGDIEATPTETPRAVPQRHALPVALGPDRRRAAADAAVHRRPGLLPRPVLPGADDRHDLRRLAPVGRPAALRSATASARRSRSSITTSQPVDARGHARGGGGLRRSLRGQGQAGQEGRALSQGRRRPPGARLSARELRARDASSRRATPAEIREDGLSFDVYLEPQARGARRIDVCRGVRCARSAIRNRGRADARDGRKPRSAATSRSGSTRRRSWWRRGSRCGNIYERSLVDLAALRFAPASRRARCRRPACPGSWRSSGATA